MLQALFDPLRPHSALSVIMANLWNVVNLNLDDQSGMVQIGNGHPLLMYLNLLVTPPPPGGGQHTIEVHTHHTLRCPQIHNPIGR